MITNRPFAARVIDQLEEGVIALLLAAMTILTFVQVILRYVFNSGITWGLEATQFMFAWLIFLGMSYGVKVSAHLGIDAAVKLLPKSGQRLAGLAGVLCCIAYSGILAWGSWAYISRIYKIGVEAQDIPIARWVFLVVLPLGFALLTFRFVQVLWRILQGRQIGLGLADEAREAAEAVGAVHEARESAR